MKKNSKTAANSDSTSQNEKSVNQSDSDKTRKSRRRLIQVLVTGGAVVTANSVPGSWSRPVVKAVILPAHAQTSGELIRLGNDGNFRVMNTLDLERTESLLASGIEQGWAEIFDTLVQEASAQDDSVGCDLTGCSYIEYLSGENSGKLFLGIFDFSGDGVSASEVVLDFTDGQQGSFVGTCLEYLNGFIVELINDTSAKLTIVLHGKKREEINLVKTFVCEPVEDGAAPR